ncbi:MAG: hypothetical protein AB1726_10560 [Planctomycetota bacterium]
MKTHSLLAAGTAFALLAAPAGADDPAAGFSLVDLPYPLGALTATLATGDIVAFDGATVERFDAQGAHLATLATFQPPVWESFLRVDPAETFALLGESTTGGLFRVDLALGGAVPVATLANNYDADFEAPLRVLVSAATCGWGCGNEIWRVDLASGATTLVALAGGASGPVAVAADGSLAYGTVSDLFPPPPGASTILRWTAAQLTGQPVATEADAEVLGAGYEAASSLAIDPADGRLYLAENDFGSGANRVRQVSGDAPSAPVLVAGAPFAWMTNLELLPGDGVALFRPYQPVEGGRLLYNTTDFAATWARRELAPARPAAFLTGPGTQGAGQVDLDVVGGPPLGIAFAAYGPSALYDPDELPIWLAAQGLNVFLGLDPSTLTLYPVLIPLDGEGHGATSFLHDGTLLGTLALQALVLHGDLRVAAISAPAFL